MMVTRSKSRISDLESPEPVYFGDAIVNVVVGVLLAILIGLAW